MGDFFFRPLAFVAGMAASLLPHRHWRRLPSWLPMESAACVSGVVTLFAGAAIGIPGFLEHAGVTVSLANETMLKYDYWQRGMAGGFSALSIFTFLLLTPKGWATLYLVGTGAVRAAAAWFDDPVGDPIATIVDSQVFARQERRRAIDARQTREALEGPEISDRIVSSDKAGIPGCDFVIVAARRKPGWERGVVVFTPSACYRIGEPIERMITGHLRTLYPLSEHTDLEAVRKSVEYDLPTARTAGAPSEPGRTTADRSE